ncbi:MAG: type VI secretion system tip protein TssI/VgrG [Polyangiaceae bacterium]
MHAGYALRVDGAAQEDLELVSYEAREALSELFRVDATVATALDRAALDALLGAPAWLTLEGQHARTLSGIVARVSATDERLEPATGHRRLVARLCIRPRLWLLSRGRDSRVFQELSVPEIVRCILEERGVPARFELDSSHDARAYAVQYDESDYGFIARIAAEEGLYFRFEDARLGEDAAVVFADSADRYPAIPGDPVIPYREAGGLAHAGETLRSLASARRVRPGRVVRSDYDPLRPRLAVTAKAEAASAGRVEKSVEVFDPRTEFDALAVGRENARVRMDAERARAATTSGESNSTRLAPGSRFRLEGHGDARENAEHVVVRCRHAGVVPRLAGARGDREETFTCRFEAVRPGVLYRPPPRRRPPSQVVESAVVVGPEGEEIYTDTLGRVKVQFHWDRRGKGDERSSCFLRVLTAWAGEGWGVQCVPRIGMEVLVTFLGGDPDRPVVLGALANETHPPPFVLPAERTRTGIRTRSTPGSTGFNELAFEDAAGFERVSIRAERDLVTSAENDRVATTGRDERHEVRRDRSIAIGGDLVHTVGKSARHRVGEDHELHVVGDHRTFVGGTETRAIEGALAESIGGGAVRAVAGGLVETIGGDVDRSIEGNALAEIALDHRAHVGGHAAVTVGTEGDSAEAIESGDATLRAKREVRVESGGRMDLLAARSFSVRVGKSAIALDEGSIRISVGAASITLTEESIALLAKSVKASAGEELALARKKTAIVLDDAIRAGADEIRLVARAASLELGTAAVLKSGQIRLVDGSGEGPTVSDDTAPAPTEEETELRLVLADADGRPYASRPYVLTLDGKPGKEARTAADGSVVETIPKGVTSGSITLDVDEDHDLVIPLDFGALPALETTAGVKARLAHLGYYSGPIDGALDRPTLDAVLRFQRRQRLEVTGRIDAPTRARIEELSTR